MIEINLIPDVKSELLKAQATRNIAFFISFIVSSVAVGIVILLALTIVTQPVLIDMKNKEIETSFKKLEDYPDIESTVTLQNQLNEIKNLRLSSPNYSRLVGPIIVAIQPVGEHSVSYSNVDYSPETKTVSIEGETKGGFPALEAFLKTIRETRFAYRLEHKEAPCSISDINNETNGCITESLSDGDAQTLEQSLGDDSNNGGKTLRFKISFVLNSSVLSFNSKDFVVLPPGRKDVTDSKTQIPDDMFKARTTDESGAE